jgi:hypothetical protein
MDNMRTVSKVCGVTGQLYSVDVNELAYQAWQDGAFIQNVMPELTSDEREFLISGLTPDEFNELFAEEYLETVV